MPFLLQSIHPLSLSHPSTTTRRFRLRVPSLKLPKGRCICAAGGRSDDDYHATLKALKSRGRTPRKSLGQDQHMAMHVRDRFEGTDRLMVLQEDFTKCYIRSHLSSLLESRETVGSDSNYAKVVSNIPFNISTDVVKLLLPMGDIFSEVVLLLQDETALRLVDASLGTSEYRPINIFVNFYSDPEYKFKVSRTNFFPQPNVDAAVVTFKLKQAANYPPVASAKSFFSMVNSAFNGKRKMLRRSLQHTCTSLEIEKALENAGLPVTSRPGELTLDDFVRLHNLITNV
ncbi:ribosomal RNA small subunit methyltransferase, chloroplastic isoform X2 [Magnolia sinica]|uniref:ribosomal RNA small subunit methyltransferase, chloroplastic isoform X2 n=1 Tax=Magnolia sinica TaxID=86752 RepID=UPI00265B4A61|nr:ribosomal RNA small subunit methyltransferase, chloroplastic isoform X2 [Magnolia sinica]